ncbi:hypothetical protein HNY73_022558 [Argiope bruennichi]|uniref:Uncharacterized protein n=1 Tax=Argiope bruennichi TaxID=94029 RepID=A0A8T0E190_ARGBR|nr:hypothetical protein HNY73_022558 [Argiope bruennichi]
MQLDFYRDLEGCSQDKKIPIDETRLFSKLYVDQGYILSHCQSFRNSWTLHEHWHRRTFTSSICVQFGILIGSAGQPIGNPFSNRGKKLFDHHV